MRHTQLLTHTQRGLFLVVVLALAAALSVPDTLAQAAQKKPAKKPQPQPPSKPVAPPAPRSSLLTHEAWQNAPRTPLAPGEIDDLVLKELEASKVEPAPRTTDEQFLRRVTLDLTGQLPLPADVKEKVNAAINEANEALKGSDIAKIRESVEKLATESQAMGSAIYAQTGPTASAGGDGGAGPTGGTAGDGAEDVVDAEIVDEEGKK